MLFSTASTLSSLAGFSGGFGSSEALPASVPPSSTGTTVAVGVEDGIRSSSPPEPTPASLPGLDAPLSSPGDVRSNFASLDGSLASGEVSSSVSTAPASSVDLRDISTHPLPPLVLIHGLKGGHLKDSATGTRRYLRVAQLFNPTRFQDPPALPLVRDDETGAQPRDTLVPDGAIDDVTLLGVNLASYYGPFEREFSEKRQLKTFSYDWRRDLDESGESLERFLEQVIEDTGSEDGVQVVCHSMGGLITFPVLNRRPELFHSVLFAAAALGGGASFLRDLAELDQGNAMGPLNNAMFTPERWVSWPSVWSFFNSPGEREAQGKSEITWDPLTEADGETPVPCDFHRVEDWRRLKLGPYGPNSGVEEVTPEMEAFLEATLIEAKAYRAQLVHNPHITYPPIAVLRSDARPTITRLNRPTPEGPFDYASAMTTAGDGRITLEDTLPPRGVPVSQVLTNHAEHSGILSELGDVNGLLNALLEEAKDRKEAAGVR